MYQNNYPYFSNEYYHKLMKTKKIKSDFNKIGIGFIIFLVILNSLIVFPVIISIMFSPTFMPNYEDFEFTQTISLASNDLVTIPSMFFAGIAILGMLSIKHNDVFQFKIKKPKRNVISLIIIAFIVFMISNVMVELYLSNLSLFGIDNDLSALTITNYSGNILDNIFYLIFVAVVPSFLEEYLFRGVLLGVLRKYGDGFAILMSSLLFGIMHGNLVQIPFAFIGGLILGYITVYSGSLIPAMIIHFMNNSFSIISDIVSNEFGEQGSIIFYIIVLVVFIVLTILSIIYLSKNDKNIFKINNYCDNTFTFKEKVKLFLKSPSILIFNILMLLQALLLTFSMNLTNLFGNAN